MGEWREVCAVEDVPAESPAGFRIDDRYVVLCQVEGEFFALDDCCPHHGAPLSEGSLKGHVLTCGWHGWPFDVRSGQMPDADLYRVRTFPVRVRQGKIEIELPDEDSGSGGGPGCDAPGCAGEQPRRDSDQMPGVTTGGLAGHTGGDVGSRDGRH